MNFPALCYVGVVFVFLGGLIYWYGRNLGRRAGFSQTWLTTRGQVQSAVIDSGQFKGRTYSYWPTVQYRYVVGDIAYQGDRIAFEKPYGSAESCSLIARRYAPGTEVDVYYDPAKPNNSVLEREAGSGTKFLISGKRIALFGGSLVVAGTIARLI